MCDSGLRRGISIHALVKRATPVTIGLRKVYDISIHALVKRATLLFIIQFCLFFYFNPRPRKEGD